MAGNALLLFWHPDSCPLHRTAAGCSMQFGQPNSLWLLLLLLHDASSNPCSWLPPATTTPLVWHSGLRTVALLLAAPAAPRQLSRHRCPF
jgi:hypothetical protein